MIAALSLFLAVNPILAQSSPEQVLFVSIEMSETLDHAAALKEADVECLTVSVGSLLVSDKSDEEFEKRLELADDS